MKLFDAHQQTLWDAKLIGSIIKVIKRSGDLSWLEPIQRFIRALLRNVKTACLVTKTAVLLYTEAVNSQTDPSVSDQVKQQLQATGGFFSHAIADEDLPSNVLLIITDTFFDQLTRHRNIAQIDGDGCIRIIATLIRSEFAKVRTDALTRVSRLVSSRDQGTEMARLCSNDAIIHEISDTIANVKAIEMRLLALKLACNIQR